MKHTSRILGGLCLLGLLLLGGCAHKSDNDTPIDRSKVGAAPGDYSISSGESSATLPFEFYGMNLMVKARINGADISMLIDNGVMWDELWFFSSNLADSLGIAYGGEQLELTGSGEGDGVDSYEADSLTIRFGDVEFTDQTAIISDASQGFDLYFPGMAGQVCGTFFKHFIVGFNFDDMQITLHEPASYVYEGAGAAIPMTRDSVGSYSIPITIETADGQTHTQNIDIDLGGVFPLTLTLDAGKGLAAPEGEKVLLGYGASGAIHGYHATLPAIQIGPYRLTDVETTLAEAHADHTVGLPVFMRYNLVFDYFHEILYIEPNENFDKPFAEDER